MKRAWSPGRLRERKARQRAREFTRGTQSAEHGYSIRISKRERTAGSRRGGLGQAECRRNLTARGIEKMPLTKDAAGAADSDEFSDRDLLIAILNGISGLSARLGGGQLVIELHSAKTGRVVAVHASAAGFVAGDLEGSVPVHTALAAGQDRTTGT
jgi:hypothetical protein